MNEAEKGATCPHISWTGVDTYFGPGKVMACDHCGARKADDWPSGGWERPVGDPVTFRQATDGAHTRVTPPEVAP